MMNSKAKTLDCETLDGCRIPEVAAELVVLLRRYYPRIRHFTLIGESPDGDDRHDLRLPCPDLLPAAPLWPTPTVAPVEEAASWDLLMETLQQAARVVRRLDPTADHVCLLVSRPGLTATTIPVRLPPH